MAIIMTAELMQSINPDVQHGSRYSDEERSKAVYMFVATGTLKRTSLATSIPLSTLYDWVKTEWWVEIVTRVREEKKEEYDAGFSRIIEEAMQVVESQLKSGDVSARDAATIMGITFDKKQILNNRPTTISGKSIDISKLQGDFERFLQAKDITSQVDYISETD